MQGTTESFFKILTFSAKKGDDKFNDSKNGGLVTWVSVYILKIKLNSKKELSVALHLDMLFQTNKKLNT